MFGPFHVEGAPRLAAHGSDISGDRPGEPLFVRVSVEDMSGKRVAGAQVDVWQADAEGFYDVQDPEWTAETADLRAVFVTNSEGQFSFRSVMPRSYPIPMDGPVGESMRLTNRHPMRPAHLHFMVQKPGYDRLVTHAFVDGDDI